MRKAELLFLLCLVVVFICLPAESSINRWLAPVKPLPHILKPTSNTLPECKQKHNVQSILKQGGKRSLKSRTKRAVSWPYECQYASIIKYQGSYQFIVPIYECCEKCKYPQYTLCAQANPSPYWLCPSGGIHCIVDCVKKNDPNYPTDLGTGLTKQTGISSIIKPGKIPLGNKNAKKFQCKKIETINGKQCIRKLCIPLGKI